MEFKLLVDGNNVICKDSKRKRIITVNVKDLKFIVTNLAHRKVWIDSRDVEIAGMTMEWILNNIKTKEKIN